MSKVNVFMIMPFEEGFFEVYEILKRKLEDIIDIKHAGNTGNLQNILVDILELMSKADVVIADLTGNNPNVLYELGIAHALNKKVIVITKDDLSDLLFDLKTYRAKDYSTHFAKFDELVDFIKVAINGAMNGSVKFGNPVSDYFEVHPKQITEVVERSETIETMIQERGFLDYLDEINQASEELTSTVVSISEDMNTMAVGIDNSSEKIKNLKNSGNTNPAVFRIQTKEAANHIDGFSKKLRISNRKLADKWIIIEKSSSDLVENKYASTEDNLPSLKSYLVSMKNLSETIANANIGVASMKESTSSLIGIEGSLNQAAKFLVDDLSDYLNVTTQMQSSISRLLNKSEILFGAIE